MNCACEYSKDNIWHLHSLITNDKVRKIRVSERYTFHTQLGPVAKNVTVDD